MVPRFHARARTPLQSDLHSLFLLSVASEVRQKKGPRSPYPEGPGTLLKARRHLHTKYSQRGFLSVIYYYNVMPSFGALLASLIAVPFCFYLMAERKEEKKLKDPQSKATEQDRDSRPAKH